MKFAAALLLVCAALASQTASSNRTSALRAFESKVDQQIAMANRAKPIDLVGTTRCFYLPGIGAVLSAKVELMRTPTINPFQRRISPQEAVEVYRTKMENLPLLRTAMKNTVMAAAKEMDFLLPADQIVFAVGLIYQPWEDTKGLPSQIVMRAGRQNAMSGDIKTEEQ